MLRRREIETDPTGLETDGEESDVGVILELFDSALSIPRPTVKIRVRYAQSVELRANERPSTDPTHAPRTANGCD